MKDETQNKAAEELKNDLHRVDEGEAAVFDTDDTIDIQLGEEAAEADSIEKLKSDLQSANDALAKEKKEYLFLMAEFDNFRKRQLKEKAELIKNASEGVLKGLLPIVDDFERGLEATKSSGEGMESLLQGMELIYNKLVKYLSDNGVKAMETNGVQFDSEIHDAIASIPAGDPDKKGIILDTTQKGYTLNDKVLRHAKVVVGE